MRSAMLAALPTYVDDEAVLVATLLGLWRASLVVLSAGRAAGLVVELHQRRGAVVAGLEPELATALCRLQLDVRACPEGFR
eukprot:6499804-Alexandrium_andersonii.AAC.1